MCVCVCVCLSVQALLLEPMTFDIEFLHGGQRSNGSSRKARTDRQTHTQTDGRYQVHYLPPFAVDKNVHRDVEGLY